MRTTGESNDPHVDNGVKIQLGLGWDVFFLGFVKILISAVGGFFFLVKTVTHVNSRSNFDHDNMNRNLII